MHSDVVQWVRMNESRVKAKKPGISRVLCGEMIPPQVMDSLAKAGVKRGDVIAAFPADVSPDGRFAERWMVIARDRVVALDGDGTRITAQEPFEGMTGLEYRRLVGGGFILVKRNDHQREVVRCSRAVDRAVQAALAKLRIHIGLDTPEAKPGKPAEHGEAGNAAEPPPVAIPELPADRIALFIQQLTEMDEQRFCGTCGIPLKQD